jgi:hypothetical protein
MWYSAIESAIRARKLASNHVIYLTQERFQLTIRQARVLVRSGEPFFDGHG